jgi:deazaflavin-dependent oxidoreductase (nitroreductase family)
LSKSQFLYLTTHGRKSGNQHKIEIWFVEHNKRYYIISERLEDAHWVQNIKHNPKVSFSINENVFNGTARVVDQEKESGVDWRSFEINEYKIQMESRIGCRTYSNKFNIAK